MLPCTILHQGMYYDEISIHCKKSLFYITILAIVKIFLPWMFVKPYKIAAFMGVTSVGES